MFYCYEIDKQIVSVVGFTDPGTSVVNRIFQWLGSQGRIHLKSDNWQLSQNLLIFLDHFTVKLISHWTQEIIRITRNPIGWPTVASAFDIMGRGGILTLTMVINLHNSWCWLQIYSYNFFSWSHLTKSPFSLWGESHLNWFGGRRAPGVDGRHNSSILNSNLQRCPWDYQRCKGSGCTALWREAWLWISMLLW